MDLLDFLDQTGESSDMRFKLVAEVMASSENVAAIEAVGSSFRYQAIRLAAS